MGIDAADAAGNRSVQATALFSTAACVDRAGPSAPTNLQVTDATQTTISMSWTASRDDVGVTGYGLYVGGKRVATTSSTSASFGGLTCGGTYMLAVDATDRVGNRSTQSAVTAATQSCDTTTPPPTSDTTAPSMPPNLRVASATQTEHRDPLGSRDRQHGRRQLPHLPERQLHRAGARQLRRVARPVDRSEPHLRNELPVRGRGAGRRRQHRPPQHHHRLQRRLQPRPRRLRLATPRRRRCRRTFASHPRPRRSIGIRWDPATDNTGVVNYRIYRNGSYIGQGPGSSGGLLDQWTDPNRICGTSYQYAVEAQDAAGNTGPRSTITASSAACSPDRAASD